MSKRSSSVVVPLVLLVCSACGGGNPTGTPAPAPRVTSAPRAKPSVAPTAATQPTAAPTAATQPSPTDAPAITLTPSPTFTPNTAIDNLVEQYITPNWRGVTVGIFRHGVPLYIQSYGYRDLGLPDTFWGQNNWQTVQPDQALNLPRGKFAFDQDTLIEIGSVSKVFTAGAILLLQQEGKLSTSDLVSKYFPNLPGASVMTLNDLLHMTSGFQEYTGFPGIYDQFLAEPFLPNGLTNYAPAINALSTYPLKFAPGTQWDYTGTNDMLLVTIVEQLSREPFPQFMKEHIFRPLGMDRTFEDYPPASDGFTDVALIYTDVGNGPERTYRGNIPYGYGAGGIVSTVRDLDKWDRATYRPGLFTAESLTEMFTPSAAKPTYADAWGIDPYMGHRQHWWDGAWNGNFAFNCIFPDDDMELIGVSNADFGPDSLGGLPGVLFQTALSM